MADLADLKVLVVDDMEDLVRFHKRWMGLEHIKVVSSLTGGGGVEQLRQNPDVDVILLDLVLPDMDDIQVFAEMRKLKPDVPVIVYSGHNDWLAKWSSQPNLKTLNKPFFLPTLKNMVGEMTGRVTESPKKQESQQAL